GSVTRPLSDQAASGRSGTGPSNTAAINNNDILTPHLMDVTMPQPAPGHGEIPVVSWSGERGWCSGVVGEDCCLQLAAGFGSRGENLDRQQVETGEFEKCRRCLGSTGCLKRAFLAVTFIVDVLDVRTTHVDVIVIQHAVSQRQSQARAQVPRQRQQRGETT